MGIAAGEKSGVPQRWFYFNNYSHFCNFRYLDWLFDIAFIWEKNNALHFLKERSSVPVVFQIHSEDVLSIRETTPALAQASLLVDTYEHILPDFRQWIYFEDYILILLGTFFIL